MYSCVHDEVIMCTGSNKVNTILDPANFGGQRGNGTMDLSGAFDPGGEIVEEVTGDDKPRKIANFFDPLSDKRDEYSSIETTTNTYEPMSEEERQRRTSLITNNKRPKDRVGLLYG